MKKDKLDSLQSEQIEEIKKFGFSLPENISLPEKIIKGEK